MKHIPYPYTKNPKKIKEWIRAAQAEGYPPCKHCGSPLPMGRWKEGICERCELDKLDNDSEEPTFGVPSELG